MKFYNRPTPILFFGIMLSISPHALAESCQPKDYSGPEWSFIRALDNSDLPMVNRSIAFSSACSELDKNTSSGGFALSQRTLMNKLQTAITLPLEFFGYMTSAFSALNNKGVQKKFQQELDQIRFIRNPHLRIAKVYELVAKYQGKYGDGGMPIRLPTRVLDKAETDGTGGVCRDFSLLLYWSLLQVARPNDGSNINFYSMEFAYGNDSSGNFQGSHQWIRINVPISSKKFGPARFEQFDLDTTFYQRQFTPLMPRQQGLSDTVALKRKEKCYALQNCLLVKWIEKNMKDIDKDPALAEPCTP